MKGFLIEECVRDDYGWKLLGIENRTGSSIYDCQRSESSRILSKVTYTYFTRSEWGGVKSRREQIHQGGGGAQVDSFSGGC